MVINNYGNKCSFKRAAGRVFLKMLFSVIPIIGLANFLFILITERNQTGHDIITNTFVVKKENPHWPTVIVVVLIGITPFVVTGTWKGFLMSLLFRK
ncbi:MAG: RDD family protein, partial [Candidatus Thermoplasmatota archaeon]|nr:RDD family protein [Candidatus Thermoplasmatota archaeon]